MVFDMEEEEELSKEDMELIFEVRKSNNKLQFRRQSLKTIMDAKKSQIVKRKIYILEKN